MNKIVLILSLNILMYAVETVAQNNWAGKADFGGTGRTGASGFIISNKGYMGCGATYTGSTLKDFWEYDPNTNVWTQKADFGGMARKYAVSFSIGNKGYVGTGATSFTPAFLKDFWEYNPTNNSWIQKSNLPGVARTYASGFSIGNKGYIGLGQDYDYVYSDFYEFNSINDSWIQISNFSGGARSGASGFSINNQGYISVGSGAIQYNDLWMYDYNTNVWIKKADLPGIARVLAISFSICEKGYLGTGTTTGGNSLNDFWEYNSTNNSWIQRANFVASPRFGAVGFAINNYGYVGTGYISSTICETDFLQYFPIISMLSQPSNISGDNYVCDNTNQTYTIQPVIGASVYTWTIPSGWFINSGQGTTNITVSVGTTSGQISVTASNSCATSSPQILNVIVNSKPAQPSSIQGSTTICANSQQQYNVNSVSGATSYTWTLPSGWVGNSTTNSITATAGNTGGTVTVVANNNCGNSTTQSLSVSVNSIPNPPVLNTNTPVCKGDTIKLSADFVSGGSYYWSGPNNFNSTIQNPIITNAAIINAGIYSCIVSVNGCTSQPSTTNININAAPSAPQLSSNSPLCVGSDIILNANTISGATYIWTGPNGFSSTQQNPVISNITLADSGKYYCSVEINGCSSTQSDINVIVSSSPVATISASGNTTFCEGDSIILSVNNAANYLWSTGDTTQNITVKTSGNYTVTISDPPGCTGDAVSSAIIVTVNTSPPAPIISQNGTTLACSANGMSQYKWFFNGVQIQSCTGQFCSCALNGDGFYSVEITNASGCVSASEVYSSNGCGSSTAIIDAQENQISLYPNPASGKLFLLINDVKGKSVQIHLSDLFGKELLFFKNENITGTYLKEIHLSELTSGIYIIKIQIGESERFEKIVINNY